MARYKFLIEYEGTRYRGWQPQKNARTVAGELQRCIHDVCGAAPFEFQGSGRTDAGVHALGQTAHLEISTMLAPEILRMKLNDLLPADIVILDIAKADPRFHARHHAVSRSYLYQISRRRTALGKRFVWWIKDPLNVKRMHEAAALFTGMHDFRSFTEDDPEDKSTKVQVEELRIAEAGDLILVRMRGSHFVWKMVRRVVGILAEVGRGSMTAEAVGELLRHQSSEPARFTAPPSGLFLERVYYPGDPILTHLQPVLHITHDR
ncbi:MAG TPA: tRNA pseudouridine(38-40) synthase TruA [Bacteroidota bacterium]|nr:tRNA pseudouridine(38-40) synthase TruA [Bacteroidota bacterium]